MSTQHPVDRPPAPRFPRCAPAVQGYDLAEVDSFLAAVEQTLDGAPTGAVDSARVRSAVFAGVRGGYRTDVVDAALEVAEEALAAAEREQFLRDRGPEAWQECVTELTGLLRARLSRPRTERFRRPSRSRTRGYSAAHVDVLCERLEARLAGTGSLEPAELRRAVFPPAQGERSYDEQQVDAFLDRSVQLLLALR